MADEPLATPAQVLDTWPGFGGLTTTRQASLIAAASRLVSGHCRRRFAQTFHDLHFDGRNLPRLWLPDPPIVSVAAVTVDGDALDNADGTGWTFDPATGELIRGNGLDDPRFPEWFPSGTRNVRVQYWAGYAEPPAPVVEATCKTVRWLWTLDQPWGAGIMKSESIGDYSYEVNIVTYPSGLPAHITVLLLDYCRDDAFV